MLWDIFKKKAPEAKPEEKPAEQSPKKAAPVAKAKAAAPEAPAKPAAATAVAEPQDQEKELEKQIEQDLNKMEPGMAAQLKNPAVRQKLLELAKRMLKDGVDIKSEKAVKHWLKDHPEIMNGDQPKVETFKRADPKVGRNDACPCGSGKKYKKCCGQAGA